MVFLNVDSTLSFWCDGQLQTRRDDARSGIIEICHKAWMNNKLS